MKKIIKALNLFLNNPIGTAPNFLENKHLKKNFLRTNNQKIFLLKSFMQVIQNYNKKNYINLKLMFCKNFLKYIKNFSKIDLILAYQYSIFFGFFKLAYEIKKNFFLKKNESFFFLSYYNFKLNLLLKLEKNSICKILKKKIFIDSRSKELLLQFNKFFKKKNNNYCNIFSNKKILVLGKANNLAKVNYKNYDVIVFVGFSTIIKNKSIKKSIYFLSDGTSKKIIENFIKKLRKSNSFLYFKKTSKFILKYRNLDIVKGVDIPDFNYFGALNLGLVCLINILANNPKKVYVKNFSLFLPIKKKVYINNNDIAFNNQGYHGGHYLYGHDPYLHFVIFNILKKTYKTKLEFDYTLSNILKCGIGKYFNQLDKFYSNDYQKRIYNLNYND